MSEPIERHVAAFEAAEPTAAPAAGNTAVDLAVDLASERPAQAGHGLRGDRSSRWLAGVMLGGVVVLLAIVGAVRAGDDAGAAAAVSSLRPQLRAPLQLALVALENVRMESITAEFVRAHGDRPIARATRRGAAPRPGRPMVTGETPVRATAPARAVVPARALGSLPAVPGDEPVAAPAPVDDRPRALPSVDEAEAEPEPEPDASELVEPPSPS